MPGPARISLSLPAMCTLARASTICLSRDLRATPQAMTTHCLSTPHSTPVPAVLYSSYAIATRKRANRKEILNT